MVGLGVDKVSLVLHKPVPVADKVVVLNKSTLVQRNTVSVEDNILPVVNKIALVVY
jgi:hypothetical protein